MRARITACHHPNQHPLHHRNTSNRQHEVPVIPPNPAHVGSDNIMFPNLYPNLRIPLPPNSTLDTYLTFVLTLSLYKFLATARPIWATIKPDLTRGTRTIR